MTTPVQDPNPPATPPDTTVNGGSDFTGGPGRPYVAPEDNDSSAVAHGTGPSRDTSGSSFTVPSEGYNGNPDGRRTDTTVSPFSTSGTEGRTASGAVVDTSFQGTPSTQDQGAPGGASYFPYRAPTEMVYVDGTPDTTLTGSRRTDVPDDNDPATLPTSYQVNQRDTTGIGGGTGPVSYTPPGSPTGVTAEAVPSRREVIVRWTPGSDPVGAPVKRWVVEGNTTGTKIVPAHEHQTVMSEGLVAGQTYRFTVYAETNFGTGYRSAPSAPVTVSKLDQVADVNYVEDDRAYVYKPDGTFTVKPDES